MVSDEPADATYNVLLDLASGTPLLTASLWCQGTIPGTDVVVERVFNRCYIDHGPDADPHCQAFDGQGTPLFLPRLLLHQMM